jgi:ubiquitin-activating enzyme E1
MQIDPPAEQQIDEGLYSRQLYVLGHEAMKRMSTSNVLIVGLKGLGIEIAKNVCLAGVKSVTLYDPNSVEIADLSAQFFLRPEDVGQPRANVTAPRLAELNQYTPVQIHPSTAPLASNLSSLDGYQVVVLTETSLDAQVIIDDYCRKHKIAFISADVRGLFGNIFCDFGENFTITDATGESVQSGIIASVDEDGLVTALDETRHGLQDGDYVTFDEIVGIEGLNGIEPRKVEVKGRVLKKEHKSFPAAINTSRRAIHIFDWGHLCTRRTICSWGIIYPSQNAKVYEL